MFLVNHPNAKLKNVTVKNGTMSATSKAATKSRGGGNILLGPEGGTVEDCVIEHGRASGWDRGGGNLWMNAGTVTRCYITKGVGSEDRGPTSGCDTGCAARMLGGTIENSVVAGNGGTVYGEQANGVTIYMTGSAKLLNCTVANNIGNTQYAGVYIADQNCRVINTAIFGNTVNSDTTGHSAVYGIGNAAWLDTVFSNCASTVSLGATSLAIADAGFVDISTGDFHLGAGSSLRDAGFDDIAAAMVSDMDYEGNDRVMGSHIDIGAYEFDVSALAADFSADKTEDYLPATVTFTAALSGKSVANPTLEWDFDGDGVYDQTTTELSVSHVYAAYGTYSVGLRVTVGTSVATAFKTDLLAVAPKTMYVDASAANPTAPYDTPATAAKTIQPTYDIAVNGCEIRLEPGVYTQAKNNCLYIEKGVKIVGTGASPDATVISNTTVTGKGIIANFFTLRHADALVANLTMSDGYVSDGSKTAAAFAISASGGTVSNCVVRHCVSTNQTVLSGGCSVSGGLVTHTVFDDCRNFTFLGDCNTRRSQGAWVEENGRIENCLFKNMRTEGHVIFMQGSAVLRNVTVADCTVTYWMGNLTDLKDQSSPKTRYPAVAIECYGGYVYNTAIVNVDRPEYLCYNNYPADPYTVPATNCANWSVNSISSTHVADSAKRFKNCVTDDPSPINNTCSVAQRARMFRPNSYIPLPGGALYDKCEVPSGWSAITDLAGKPRVFGKSLDVGCYECQLKPGFMVIVR